MSGQDEDAGADDGTNAQRDEVRGRKAALERHTVTGKDGLGFGLLRPRQQRRNGLLRPKISHPGPEYSASANRTVSGRHV
jgi:hypothetical protein